MTGWFTGALCRTGAFLDGAYAQAIHNLTSTKFFWAGWGDIGNLNSAVFGRIVSGVQRRPRDYIRVDWGTPKYDRAKGVEYELCQGKLTHLGPGAAKHIPNIPESCETGRVWLMRPRGGGEWGPCGMRACCIQLAATGEQDERCATLASRLPS